MASGETIDEGICLYHLTEEAPLNFLKPKAVEILPLFLLLSLLDPLVYQDSREFLEFSLFCPYL